MHSVQILERGNLFPAGFDAIHTAARALYFERDSARGSELGVVIGDPRPPVWRVRNSLRAVLQMCAGVSIDWGHREGHPMEVIKCGAVLR